MCRSRIASKKKHRSRGSKKTPSDGISLLPQKEAHHNKHMPLKMRAQERKRFLERARREYSRTKKKKAKGAMIDAVVQFVGYKSRKQAIRALNSHPSTSASPRHGRVKKLNAKQVEILRKIWFAMDQPCGKRMQPVLRTWLEHMEKPHGKTIPPCPTFRRQPWIGY